MQKGVRKLEGGRTLQRQWAGYLLIVGVKKERKRGSLTRSRPVRISFTVSGDGLILMMVLIFDFDSSSGNDRLSFVSCLSPPPSILQFKMSSCCQQNSNLTSPDNIVGIVNTAYSARAREGVTAACESCLFLSSVGLYNHRK